MIQKHECLPIANTCMMQPIQGGTIGIVIVAVNYEPYRDDIFSHQAVERAFAFNVAWYVHILEALPFFLRGKALPFFIHHYIVLQLYAHIFIVNKK